ncbi:MAG: transporter substrate-binding domain-containing protein, partial [Clostridia bacterium]|nr:transporter substrate-binding domain-containing protein [Clostridia bacterium]
MQKIKLWLVVLAALLLVGCSQSQTTEFEEYSQLGQLEGKRVGVLGGSVFYALIGESVKGSSLQIYGSYADLCLALQTHKMDVIVTAQPIARILAEETGFLA